jgi:hypothetical protein
VIPRLGADHRLCARTCPGSVVRRVASSYAKQEFADDVIALSTPAARVP